MKVLIWELNRICIVLSNNKNNNKVNILHFNDMKFDYNYSLSGEIVSKRQPVETLSPREYKRSTRIMHMDWYVYWKVVPMIQLTRKYIQKHPRKNSPNKLYYSTVSGMYFTTYDVKLKIYIMELSGSKVTLHRWRFIMSNLWHNNR